MRLVALLLLSLLGTAWPAAGQARRPKLIVLLMVDQMRADYVDRYQHQWSGGLRRLLSEGAWFREADYPYAGTVTCAGHASVSTGTLPSTHGMIGNTWWDRDRGRVVACADDPVAADASYGRPVNAPGEGPWRLMVPTLADELRSQLSPTPRVISISLKARSAVTLGGQRPDAVAWAVDQGAFVTSTAYPQGPSSEIAEFVSRHPVEPQLWTTWDRALPRSAYAFDEQAIGVRSDATPSFPHDIRTWDDWQTSPLADEYVAQMALDVATRMKLGSDGRTDMIAISFSALDLVGHIYGPNSHEVQDLLVRLDRTIGDLLGGLDRLAGRGTYVVALSSDHGVAPTPEREQQFGLDAWRIAPRAVTDAAQAAIAHVLGRGRYVNRLMTSDLYLEDGVYEQLQEHDGALEAVRRVIAAVPGVQAVYTQDDLATADATGDHLARMFANSFVPSRSGDFVIAYKPYWLVGGQGGTSHGTPYRYDTHVPVVLMGPGIAAGEYLAPITPLDIAPTLAALAGITLPNAQGHVLVEALSATRAAAPSGSR